MPALSLPPASPPVVLAADLSSANVEVTTGYSGARISVYGAVLDPAGATADVVVVVRGPDEPIAIARRERRAGLWVTGAPQRVTGAPGFHLTASSGKLSRIADPQILRRSGAGLQGVTFSVPGGEAFRQALLRLRSSEGLYVEDPSGVEFVDRGLFRAQLRLPASAPVGAYKVDVILFRAGQPIAVRSRVLTIEKVGVERIISGFAHKRPWAYGMVSVLMALVAGWAASAAFRRV
ncbi:MAG: TIGR02186 family protein [Phenylobacterium sp.]